MNIFCGIGRLTKNPDIRVTQGEEPMTIARFTLAINRIKKDEADYISCVAFKKTADIIEKYCQQGSQVGVTGHIQTGSYQKQDGTKVYTTDVIVDKLDLCGSSQESKPEQKPKTEAEQSGFVNVPDDLNDGTLPFN